MFPFVSARIDVVAGLAACLLLAAGCANRDIAPADFGIETPPPFSPAGELEPPDPWWVAFDVPELDRAIDEAFANNYTLAAAADRLAAARALTRREASDLVPDLDGVLGYFGVAGPGEDRGTFEWGLDTSYQVDLWGQIGSRVEAERLRADATEADYQAIALSLAAEVARTWFSLIEARAQVELLREQIETNQTGLVLQERRFAEGLIRSPDVLRQRQLLESTREQLAIARSRIEILEHGLAILLGQMPQTASFDPGSVLPELPPLPATGLSSELLVRRPDIRRDYLALQAADRDVASAISARFPRLNLSGSLINATEDGGDLLKDWFASIAGQLIAPLFDGGQRLAEVDRTTAVLWQRFNEYVQTILIAFGEVEDSLAQEKYQRERIRHLEEQLRLAGESANQLREQYLNQFDENSSYLDVLSALQAEQALQRQRLSAQLELIQIRVSLYLALAGDAVGSPPVSVEALAPSVPLPTDVLEPLPPLEQDSTEEDPPEIEFDE